VPANVGKSPKSKHARRRAPRAKRAPGPKPSITLAVVLRVCDRVAVGSTLKLALAAECVATINEETWKKALKAHPEFYPHYEGARGKFIEAACRRLAADEDTKYLCWLLERRHGDLFHKSDPPPAVVNVSQHVGIPADVLERAREVAKTDIKRHD
jgi:hypothetical protein